MLNVENLDVSIGTAGILHGASLQVPPGSMCGLIGRNGAGKTTLMRAVMGLIPARAGKIEFEQVDLRKTPAHRRAHLGIGYLPEDRRLVPEFTVEDNVLIPAWSTDLQDTAARLKWVYGLMPEVKAFGPRRANQLSGGQGKLAALARALMCGTKFLLLDEPFEGVAPALARRLAEVLSNLKAEGLSVLVAESNEKHVADLMDRIYVIERGSINQGNGAGKASA